MKQPGLSSAARRAAYKLWQQRVLLCLAALTLLYAFLVWRVAVLNAISPAQTTESPASARSRISQPVIDKIKQLKDNSQNVQALFEQARQNPFRE